VKGTCPKVCRPCSLFQSLEQGDVLQKSTMNGNTPLWHHNSNSVLTWTGLVHRWFLHRGLPQCACCQYSDHGTCGKHNTRQKKHTLEKPWQERRVVLDKDRSLPLFISKVLKGQVNDLIDQTVKDRVERHLVKKQETQRDENECSKITYSQTTGFEKHLFSVAVNANRSIYVSFYHTKIR